MIGAGDCLNAVLRRGRQFRGEVIAGGAAFSHHLDGADVGGEILVLEGLAASSHRIGVEQQFQRPAIGKSLGKMNRRVGVTIDKSWNKQAPACIDRQCVFRHGFAGR